LMMVLTPAVLLSRGLFAVAQDTNLMTPAASAQPNVAVGLGFWGMAV
jgi:hypothetical protein